MAAATSARYAGARTFTSSEGVWVDTAFDAGMMSVTVVGDGSTRCYDLNADPVVAAYPALGRRVIRVDDGLAYQVTLGAEVAAETTMASAERTEPWDSPRLTSVFRALIEQMHLINGQAIAHPPQVCSDATLLP